MALQWQCSSCEKHYPPTERGHKQIMAHVNLGHPPDARHYKLVDVDTGEVVAANIEDAREEKLLISEEVYQESLKKAKQQRKAEVAKAAEAVRTETAEAEVGEVAESPTPIKEETDIEEEEGDAFKEGEVYEEEAEEGEAREKPREIRTPEITDGVLRYTVTLPADAFTLFNIARGYGLEKDDKLFDEFLFDCITKRFETDYKMQLILAPIEEG